jgi:hypothetical protein
MKTKLIIFLLTLSITLISCEPRTIEGKVISHELVADRYGERIYITLIQTDNGTVEEVIGLKTYVIPIGSRVRIKM